MLFFCGETGIRTPETLLEFTRFPGVPLQPLEHLSFALRNAVLFKIGYKITTFLLYMQIFCKKNADFVKNLHFLLVNVVTISPLGLGRCIVCRRGGYRAGRL